MKRYGTDNIPRENETPPTAVPVEDVSRFKAAMRKLTSAVTVITTCHKDRIAGLTATAVTPLSVQPPSLVACVNKSASAHELLIAEGRFCVNIMDARAVDVAELFSDKARSAARFDSVGWQYGATGLPVLDGSVAHFECTLERAVDGFSHTILIGVVVETFSRGGVPLLYEAGRYGAFKTL